MVAAAVVGGFVVGGFVVGEFVVGGLVVGEFVVGEFVVGGFVAGGLVVVVVGRLVVDRVVGGELTPEVGAAVAAVGRDVVGAVLLGPGVGTVAFGPAAEAAAESDRSARLEVATGPEFEKVESVEVG